VKAKFYSSWGSM